MSVGSDRACVLQDNSVFLEGLRPQQKFVVKLGAELKLRFQGSILTPQGKVNVVIFSSSSVAGFHIIIILEKKIFDENEKNLCFPVLLIDIGFKNRYTLD